MADEETKERDEQEQDQAQEQGQEAEGSGDQDERSKDQEERDKEYEEAKEEIKQLEEEGPPDDLEDWPEGKAKYETFGGPEGEHAYDEGPEAQLGPSSLRHHEDGSVTVAGEEVDDPDEYKGKPIPGGPTDPDTPNMRMDKADADDEGEPEGGDDSKGDDSEGDESEERGGSDEEDEAS